MSYAADEIGGHMHGAIGGIANAAMAAFVLSRQDGDRRAAQQAACSAAASRARAGVLDRTNEDLRERLADAHADIEFLEEQNAALRAQVAELTRHRQILADALRDARAV